MRRTALLAAALATVPLPAAADVTARYDLGKEQLSVEVDDSGDYRAEIPGKVLLLRKAGVDYVVIFQAGTPLVIERQSFLAIAKNMVPATPAKSAEPRLEVQVAKAGEESIAGRKGTLWTIGVDKPGGNMIEAVMSPDRDLAPVGAVFANVLDAGLQTFGAVIPASNFAESIREVMAKGTPLRLMLMQEVRLRSVSTTDIDPARFALPGSVVDSKTFDQAMSADTSKKSAEVPVPAPPLP
jgi:hypothetical protein